ncbi:MAG TPA: hypothetical protein VFJ22_02575 [Dermatophilaceae bacterium]|nr:hypothetical protein [Dermatophilaceae bacterium]
MRWDRLFDDLEAQWDAQARRDLDSEIADRTRRERAAVEMFDRVAAHMGQPLQVRLVTRSVVEGLVADLGKGWMLVDEGGGRSALVSLPAVMSVTGLGSRAQAAVTARRFGLGYALRGLSRDRAVVQMEDVSGVMLTGTIDAVGADACDFGEHAADEPRRRENVRAHRTLPFEAIACVRPVAGRGRPSGRP